MTTAQIYEILTGNEKDRFIKEMGQDNYNKLIDRLEKILLERSLNNIKEESLKREAVELKEDEEAWNHYLSIKSEAIRTIALKTDYWPSHGYYHFNHSFSKPSPTQLGLFLRKRSIFNLSGEMNISDTMKVKILEDFNNTLREHKIAVTIGEGKVGRST